MVKIKMCGLRREEDIKYANILRPEYIGFVFALKSKRYVEKEQARILSRLLCDDIVKVGVFVNSPLEYIYSLFREGIIDMAQLHGDEDEEYIKDLKIRNIPTIKAFKIKSKNDIIEAENSFADFVLLDSGSGSGESFDWSLIDIKRDYFLAGGLNAENVAQALRRLSPFAVDVSSGIEREGYKSFEKMLEFKNIVRGEI